jgi:cobalt transporter subunit CbtA
MLFRRVFLCALLVGVCGGLLHSIVQRFQVVPIIAAAEVFESRLAPAPRAHDHAPGGAPHAHESEAWEPEPGLERTFWTVVANLLASVGFALLLIPAFAAWDRTRPSGHGASVRNGLLWGVAGWICVYAWPALGLPPELPGEASAPLAARQAWWVLAVASAVAGLSVLCLVRHWWRVFGVALLALPFVIGAPHADGAAFGAFDADAAKQMATLKARFLVATAIAGGVHWLALGALSGGAIQRWLRPLLAPPEAPTRQPDDRLGRVH